MLSIHYVDLAGEIVVGRPATVWMLEFPALGWTHTGVVMGYDLYSNKRGPIFWTRDGTRYVPANTDETLPVAKGGLSR